MFDQERAERMRQLVLQMGDCYLGLRDFSKTMLVYHTCVPFSCFLFVRVLRPRVFCGCTCVT